MALIITGLLLLVGVAAALLYESIIRARLLSDREAYRKTIQARIKRELYPFSGIEAKGRVCKPPK